MASNAIARAEQRQQQHIDLQIQAELKKQIISQAQSRYGSKYPPGSHFDVFIGTLTSVSYTAHIVKVINRSFDTQILVYTVPGSFHERKMVEVGERAEGPIEALEKLLQGVSEYVIG